MDYIPLSNHNQLQRSPQQRARVSRDQTAVVAVVAGASLGPTREQPVALAGPLTSGEARGVWGAGCLARPGPPPVLRGPRPGRWWQGPWASG